MVYIDLNMVRAGVVSYPEDWCWSGSHEIQKPPQRYAVIDKKAYLVLIILSNINRSIKGWVEGAHKAENSQRMLDWTQNLAVGRQDYVAKVKSALGLAVRHRTVVVEGDVSYTKRAGNILHSSFRA